MSPAHMQGVQPTTTLPGLHSCPARSSACRTYHSIRPVEHSFECAANWARRPCGNPPPTVDRQEAPAGVSARASMVGTASRRSWRPRHFLVAVGRLPQV